MNNRNYNNNNNNKRYGGNGGRGGGSAVNRYISNIELITCKIIQHIEMSSFYYRLSSYSIPPDNRIIFLRLIIHV